MAKGHPSPHPADLERRCKELGVPMTVQRRAVYALLAGRDDHPTADQIFADLQDVLPGISKATAYRTLDKLVELGLVRRVSHPGAAARFDAKTHRHHHLVCERCGAMLDLESGALDALRVPDLRSQGFEVRDFSVQIHGRCQDCTRKAGSNEDTPRPAGRSDGSGRAAPRTPSRTRRKR